MAVKQRKSAQTLAAGDRLGKMDGIVSLNRLQAHGKWEMSASGCIIWGRRCCYEP